MVKVSLFNSATALSIRKQKDKSRLLQREICFFVHCYTATSSASARSIRAASTRLIRLSEVSFSPRVFSPQSGFTHTLADGIFATILCKGSTISVESADQQILRHAPRLRFVVSDVFHTQSSFLHDLTAHGLLK